MTMEPSSVVEMDLWWLATEQELIRVCDRIVVDGRDPYIVAQAMMERLASSINEYQKLWDAAFEEGTCHA